MKIFQSFLIASLVFANFSAACALPKTSTPTVQSGTVVEGEAANDFPRVMPKKADKKAMRRADIKPCAAFSLPIMPEKDVATDISIMGAAEASEEQMAAYIKKRNPNPKLNCSVESLVRYYYIEAGRENIRPDIAISQAIKETGAFNYGGDVLPKQNNFCGLGATGNKVKGASFATPQLGVRAHIQHLLAYASYDEPSVEIIDPRYWLVVKNHPEIHGKITKWTGLNGVWAVPGTTYGEDILKIWRGAKVPDGSDASLSFAMKQISLSPDDADAYTYRAAVYIARNNIVAARSDLKKAIELHASAELYYDRALTANEKQREDAIKDYTEAIKLNAGFTEAWYNRGVLYLAGGKHKEAVRDFEKALELDPRLVLAKNNIGVSLLRRKKYKDAWAAFYDAYEINSTNETLLDNIKTLRACVKK